MLTHLPLLAPRPFLKWAGGKGQLISQYIPYFPSTFQNYYEPFLGGGAVFFHLQSRRDAYWRTPPVKQRLQPPTAILSDINSELINVYCCVRDDVEALILLLAQHQQQHSKEYYYQIRSQPFTTNLESAARFIYLNKTCFNGLYRENSKGEFNVPMGKYKNPGICQAETLRLAYEALANVQIEVRQFETVLDYANAEDFVYFDPPYYPLNNTSNFTTYHRGAFTEVDQIRLSEVFAALAQRGVKVMLSNSDCDFIKELYNEFNIYVISASRAINSNANKRGKIIELLITSY